MMGLWISPYDQGKQHVFPFDALHVLLYIQRLKKKLLSLASMLMGGHTVFLKNKAFYILTPLDVIKLYS
jgi:hypothetical protein